jgi:hypothetical protein
VKYTHNIEVTKRPVEAKVDPVTTKLNPNAGEKINVTVKANYQIGLTDIDPTIKDGDLSLSPVFADESGNTITGDIKFVNSSKSGSTYEITTPDLKGETKYTLSLVIGGLYKFNDSSAISTDFETKIRSKLNIINTGNVGYAKDGGAFNHAVTYQLVDENNAPLVNKPVTITGKGTLYTDSNGNIVVNYNSYGGYILTATYAGNYDIQSVNATGRVNIIKTAGANKQILTHIASWGSAA